MVEETKTAARLSDAQWAEIRELYALGEASASELADRYGVTPSALSQHFKKHSVIKGSRAGEIAKKVEEEVKAAHVAAVVNFESQRRQRIEKTREDTYKSLEFIGLKTMQLLSQAASATPPRTPAAVLNDLKAMRLAAAIVEQTRVGRLQVLQADRDIDETALPQLVIDDLSPEDIKKIQERDTDDGELILPDVDEDDDFVSEGEDD